MSEKHSPLPWVIRPREFDDWGWIRGSDGELACIARGDTSSTWDAHRKAGTDPSQANADLIVRAVNGLPEAIAALEESAKCIEDLGSGKGGWAWEEVLDGIQAALAKLKAEP